MRKEVTDEQLKAQIMHMLKNRGRWGANYFPSDTLVNWLDRKIKRDGRRVGRALKELVSEGYLVPHKKGATVSLNPARSKEIIEFIGRVLKI